MKRENLLNNKIFKIVLSVGMFMFILLGALSPLLHMPNSLNNKTASATTISEYSSITDIYIYSPAYSTTYNGKIYFVDSYDYMLKICDISTKLYEEPVSLEKYKEYEIKCAESVDAYLFLVFSNSDTSKLVSINLGEDTPAIYETDLEAVYNQIYVSQKAENKFYVALTSSAPIILELDFTEAYSDLAPSVKKVTLTIDYEEIKNSLFKFLIQPQSDSDNVSLIFVYDKKVGFCSVQNFGTEVSGNITVSQRPNLVPLDIEEFNDKQIDYINVNMLYIDLKPYLLISYKETLSVDDTTQSELYSNIYNFNYPNLDTGWEFKGRIASNFNVLTNGSNIIYSEGQSITFKTISSDNFDASVGDTITNPDITITSTLDDMHYYQTKATTNLLLSPWNYNSPILEIPNGTDVICIATATVPPDIEISDYYYCLITTNENGTDKNVTGFIKASNLVQKEEVRVDDEYGHVDGIDYPRITVIPKKTRLYTHPTSIVGTVLDVNNEILFTNDFELIPENSKVEVIDVIYNYKQSNNTQDVLLKVRVNHDMNHEGTIGYITQSSIIKNTDRVEFLVTNATISGDAYVYLDKDESSTIVDVLKSGKTVKILEGRNSHDGYTYIVYNDVFGNECYGYVKNDFLVTDNWTTMQIIGCVLIAVNLGLLVLILVFKYKKLGPHGENYTKNKTENKKQA